MIHDVVAQHATGIRKAAAAVGNARIQQYLGRGHGGGAEEHDTRMIDFGLLGVGVHHPHSGDAFGPGVIFQVGHHLVRQQGQIVGLARRGQSHGLGREISAERTTAGAHRAALATRPPLLRLVLGHVGGAGGNQLAARHRLFQPFLDPQLRDIHRMRRLVFAVRQLRQALFRAGNAGIFFDIGIPGRDLIVSHRPGAAMAIALVGHEIDLAPA